MGRLVCNGRTSLESIDNQLDESFALQAYPNPFGQDLMLHYELESSAEVKVVIRSLLGQTVWEQASERRAAGPQDMQLQVGHLAKGTYLLQVWVDGRSRTMKVVKW